jgi:hypothetical protein
MKTLQLKSSVSQDGILELRIPLGVEEAGQEVTVTVQTSRSGHSRSSDDRAEWHRFVEETYGSCAGMGLERPEQLPLENRIKIE